MKQTLVEHWLELSVVIGYFWTAGPEKLQCFSGNNISQQLKFCSKLNKTYCISIRVFGLIIQSSLVSGFRGD